MEIELTDKQYELLCYALGLATAHARLKGVSDPRWKETEQNVENLFNHITATATPKTK